MDQPYDINIEITSYDVLHDENGTVQISRKFISKEELIKILNTLSTDIEGKGLVPYLSSSKYKEE